MLTFHYIIMHSIAPDDQKIIITLQNTTQKDELISFYQASYNKKSLPYFSLLPITNCCLRQALIGLSSPVEMK